VLHEDGLHLGLALRQPASAARRAGPRSAPPETMPFALRETVPEAAADAAA